ncbi:MAG TPA: DUF92 domain-containing protein, partial [archaeon]|nr:DUF92 domain-containing protein [archaeon]
MVNNFALVFGAALASAALGYVGWRFKVVDKSGYASGVVLATAVMAFVPMQWFIPLVSLVVIGGAASRYKVEVKRTLGVAERRKGRGALNVFGNGGVALACALTFELTQNPLALVAYISSISAACADTVAAEIGQLSRKKPLLITTLAPVRTGTDGGITLQGTIAGLLGAALVSLTVYAFSVSPLVHWKLFAASALAGFIGTNADSLIGATLERARKTDKHSTNFLASLTGAVAGI